MNANENLMDGSQVDELLKKLEEENITKYDTSNDKRTEILDAYRLYLKNTYALSFTDEMEERIYLKAYFINRDNNYEDIETEYRELIWFLKDMIEMLL